MPDSDFTAEKFSAWMTARDAFAAAQSAFESSAARTLLERLDAGLIEARAQHFFAGHNRTDIGFSQTIPPKVWNHLKHTDFPSRLTLWTTNDLVVEIFEGSFRSGSWQFFGIRFDPIAVKAMLPPQKYKGVFGSLAGKLKQSETAPELLTSAPQTNSERAVEPAFQATKDLPPVAEAHLREWFKLYRQVYVDQDETEAVAIRSATGMFPGRFVSRGRVRALRGAQKRGPKPKGPAK